MGIPKRKRVTADEFNRADAVDKFLGDIVDEVKNGARFVPFLGSGLSAASGIPTAQNFAIYFCHCLRKAMGIGNVTEEKNPHLWTWPRLSEVKTCGKKPEEQDASFWTALQNKRNHITLDGSSEDVKCFLKSLDSILAEKEKRSTFTWQLGLECLSRLFNQDEMAGVLDESIIDTFCIELIGTRQPNLGHTMLAHLADALRMQTILTTNFDTLVEKGFKQVGVELASFDVHRNAGLPDSRLVLGQRSLVKLNGGRYGLRADQSVNDDVKEADRIAVIKYFPKQPTTHLLVLGTTFAEDRTIGFLRAITTAKPGMRVFWMCFDPKDLANIKLKLNGIGIEKPDIVVHHNIGLLLLQLYQRLFHSLPPAGAEYPAFWRIPPYPYVMDKSHKGGRQPEASAKRERAFKYEFSKSYYELKDAIENKSAASRVTVVDGHKGASSVCAAVWDTMIRSRHCVWLELDDFMSPGDAFISLMNELAHQVGLSAPGPFHESPKWQQCRDEIGKCIEEAQKPCVIFLNGRDGPGHSAGWLAPDVSGVVRGYQPSSQWGSDYIAEYWQMLRDVFTRSGTDRAWLENVTVVAMVRPPRKLDQYARNHRNTADHSLDDGQPLTHPGSSVAKEWRKVRIKDCIPFAAEDILERTLEWIAEEAKSIVEKRLKMEYEGTPTEASKKEKQDILDSKTLLRFVYAMTLFRHSRHPSALFTWGLIKARERLSVGVDNDGWRAGQVETWLKALHQRGVIRTKPGGFAWMHRDLRNGLRERLETSEPWLKGRRAECHQGIADWYAKLFRSSNDPQAALESLYHRLCCIEFAGNLSDDESCGDPEHVRETACIEAISILKLAQSRIVSCGYFTASSNLIQQIELATSRMKSERANQLCQMCRETLRDFAREAADFKTAARFNDRLERGLVPEATSKVANCTLSQTDLRHLERQYYDGVILTGLRAYDRAQAEFHDLFRQLGFPHTWREACHWSDFPSSDIRQMGRDWARSQKGRADVLKLAIRSCRRYMFLQMLIGQAYQYASEMELRKADETAGRSPPKFWQARGDLACRGLRRYSERIYILGTEIMRYVDDHEFLQIENTYIRTLYGVLLATIGRCEEAHRRLNEAAAYLAHSPKRNDAVTEAVLLLRRAEAYLCQAEDAVYWPFADIIESKLTGSESLHLAYLEDAHSCLVQARERMQIGQRKDAWWWTLMYELQIRVCALTSEVCDGCEQRHLSFCKKCQDGSYAKKVLAEAATLTTGDPFRLARLTILFKDLMCHRRGDFDSNVRPSISESIERIAGAKRARDSEEYSRYPLDNRVADHINEVMSVLTGLGKGRSQR